MKQITKKEYIELCKKYEPIYIADEVNDKGNSWRVYRFNEVDGEYHERVKQNDH